MPQRHGALDGGTLIVALVAAAALCPATAPVAPVADPEAPAPDALIACVGKSPITGARFSHWDAIARKGTPAAQAEDVRLQVMDFLVSSLALEGEAAERGIHVSDRAVTRQFNAQRREAFPTKKAFRRFLKESGFTRSDLKYRVRLDLLSDRLRHAVMGPGRAKQRRLERFVEHFHAKWLWRTSCLAPYVVEQCGVTLTPADEP